MSNPATNRNGLAVLVGDQVTILGAVTVIAGSGVGRPSGTTNATDTATVMTILGDTLSVQAGDCKAVDDQPVNNNARSTNGFPFAVNDQVTVNGVMQSVTAGPMGFSGTLTVTTDFSGTLITVLSGTVDNG